MSRLLLTIQEVLPFEDPMVCLEVSLNIAGTFSNVGKLTIRSMERVSGTRWSRHYQSGQLRRGKSSILQA